MSSTLRPPFLAATATDSLGGTATDSAGGSCGGLADDAALPGRTPQDGPLVGADELRVHVQIETPLEEVLDVLGLGVVAEFGDGLPDAL